MLQSENKINIRLRVRCLRIAERIVLSNTDKDVDQVLIEYSSLFEHADKFYKFCQLELYTLEECKIDSSIIFPTLSYIERHFAMPELLNDFNWFPDTLNTLLSFFTADNSRIKEKESHEFIILFAEKLKERTNHGKD